MGVDGREDRGKQRRNEGNCGGPDFKSTGNLHRFHIRSTSQTGRGCSHDTIPIQLHPPGTRIRIPPNLPRETHPSIMVHLPRPRLRGCGRQLLGSQSIPIHIHHERHASGLLDHPMCFTPHMANPQDSLRSFPLCRCGNLRRGFGDGHLLRCACGGQVKQW